MDGRSEVAPIMKRRSCASFGAFEERPDGVKPLAWAALTAVLASCAVRPTDHQLAAADLGPPPSRAVAEQAARSYFDKTLEDPARARIRMGDIRRSFYAKSVFDEPKLAWALDAFCSVADDRGRYAAEKPYWFYFHDGTICAFGMEKTSYTRYGENTRKVIVEMNGGGRTMAEAGLQ